MMIAGIFEIPASVLAFFYSLTTNYAIAISIMAVLVMLLVTPLNLKSTKGMLEMQRLAPEMRRLQQQYRGDRQKLNEETMKLYSEHKVNPLASCFPLLLQMPVFIIMFRVLHGLTAEGPDGTFQPKYIKESSDLYKSLVGKTEMNSWGLDLAARPVEKISESFSAGLVYAMLVVALGALYFLQQRMVASRASVSPTISPAQQKIMQYLPVVFAGFQFFFLTGLVIYYMAQAFIRIGLNYYITHRFYKDEHSLGRQAQAAGAKAREIAQQDKSNGGGGGGLFAQAKREAAAAKEAKAQQGRPTTSKRVTPPKNKPTPAASARTNSGRPASSGKASRPNTSNKSKKK